MAKLKCPLLRPLRKTGLTLYTFPSASEDISLNFNTGTQGVGMSHYALLNFTKKNFNFTDSADIAKSLQNWLMNSETVLLNQSTYNYQEPQTVSEHVFWKWLAENSAGNFAVSVIPGSTDIYRENNYSVSNADRLIQCFGAIDSGNYLSTDFGMFNETYVNIPTSYGNGPVFFRSAEDTENYKKNVGYRTGSFLEGRSDSDKTYLAGTNPLKPLISEYKDEYALEIVKDIPSLDRACKMLFGSSASIRSYDDINVDPAGQFNASSDYNINNGKNDFKFNAVLLYYSIYDMNDVNKDPVATNLFGILFLDGGQTVLDNDYLISPITKKKSYKGTQSGESYFGNGYSFRVNIKTLSVYDNTDAVIQDNTTTTGSYAQDFNDVISNLNRAISIMNTNLHTTSAIQNRYMEMRSEFVDIKNRFSELSDSIKSSTEDMLAAKVADLSERIDYAINGIRAELGLDQEDDYADAVVGSASSVSENKLVSTSMLKHLVPKALGMSASRQNLGTYTQENTGTITDSRVNIVSATSANVNAKDDINLTGSEIYLNFKSDGKVTKVPVSKVFEKIAMLETMFNDFAVQSLIDKEEKLEEKKNKSEQTSQTSASMSFDTLIALGIIPINDILLPRAKKPETAGYYLKTNTSGNILQYVLFDGEDYKETIKCETGKMYSVRGTIYVFDGETCKKLGENLQR